MVVGALVGGSANVTCDPVTLDSRRLVRAYGRRARTVEGGVGQVGRVEPMREPSRGMRQ